MKKILCILLAISLRPLCLQAVRLRNSRLGSRLLQNSL